MRRENSSSTPPSVRPLLGSRVWCIPGCLYIMLVCALFSHEPFQVIEGS